MVSVVGLQILILDNMFGMNLISADQQMPVSISLLQNPLLKIYFDVV